MALGGGEEVVLPLEESHPKKGRVCMKRGSGGSSDMFGTQESLRLSKKKRISRSYTNVVGVKVPSTPFSNFSRIGNARKSSELGKGV